MTKNYIGFITDDLGPTCHLTMLFTGDLDDEMEAQYARILDTLTPRSYYVDRHSIQMFGPDNNIPVITVNVSDDLVALQETIAELFHNDSGYPWNPHITLPTEGGDYKMPQRIRLHSLGLY